MRIALLVLLLAGCALDVPSDAAIECVSNAECPNGFVCNPASGRCVPNALEADSMPPQPSTVIAVDAETVQVVFNEDVEASSATTLANYTIEGLGIRQVSLEGARAVLLETEPQAPERQYELTIRSVADPSGNRITDAGLLEPFRGFGTVDRTAPELLSPGDGATVVGTSVQLFWSERVGVESYRVRVSTDREFTSPIFDQTLNGTSALVDLADPRTYFWTVESDAMDGAGNVATIESLLDGVFVYCSSGEVCSDAGQVGNLTKPLRSISAGVATALAEGIGRVLVASRGEDEVYEGTVTVLDGISLIGGYTADFSEPPDPVANPTWISSAGASTLIVDRVSTTATSVEGFIIENSEAGASQVIVISDSTNALRIADNTIRAVGPSVDRRRLSRAVSLTCTESSESDGGPLLEDNTITAGEASTFAGGFAVGVDCLRCGLRMRRNTIDGGAALGLGESTARYETRGVSLTECDAELNANRIFSGRALAAEPDGVDPTDSADLFGNYVAVGLLSTGSTFVANNNEIVAEGWGNVAAFRASPGDGGGGILAHNTLVSFDETQPNTAIGLEAEVALVNNLIVLALDTPVRIGARGPVAPSALLNNAFINAVQLVNVNSRCQCVSGEDLACLDGCADEVEGNVEALEAGFAELGSDYRLTTDTPESIRRGGRLLSAELLRCETQGKSCGPVLEDIDGTRRSCPDPETDCVSIGAYEED